MGWRHHAHQQREPAAVQHCADLGFVMKVVVAARKAVGTGRPKRPGHLWKVALDRSVTSFIAVPVGYIVATSLPSSQWLYS